VCDLGALLLRPASIAISLPQLDDPSRCPHGLAVNLDGLGFHDGIGRETDITFAPALVGESGAGMRCLNCGSLDHLPDARFCGHCGQVLSAAPCLSCGGGLDVGHKFCPRCGNAVSTSTSDGLPPISYTPSHLVDRFLAARATIEGELKQATILFVDIVDSTRLTHDKDPETANNVLGPAIELMRQSVFRYEGYVRPRGDGIQGLFGVPLSHEDHAVRGCLAALELLAGIERQNCLTGESEPIRVRAGLNSGEVIVKRIRDDLLLELDAIGPTVALASRMERLAAPNTVLATAATFALADSVVSADSRGQIEVRGVGEPVEVFQLKSVRQRPLRFRQPADGVVTSFVGRALELDTLSYACQEANQGQGQIVAFVGEPGVGKSRLVAEFARSHHLDGALVLEARSVSYGRATPYLPIVNLLHGYFEIHASDQASNAQEKIDGKLRALGSEAPTHRAAVFELLALGVDDANWRDFDPVERRQSLQEAVIDILLREARSRPLCLIFEDLHWIDSETRAILDKLADLIPTRRILMLVNYRPEYRADWGRKTYFRQLPVAPLPTAIAHRLLDDLLGTHATLAELKVRLIEQTSGNPLFLEECVQMLRAQGVLHGDRGAAELVQPLGLISFLPASVQSTLKARVDRLDLQQKHVLDFASVLGKDFSYVNLQAAIDIDAAALQTCLGELQAFEFVYQTRREPEPEFTFKHALTYQVVYRSLLSDRRRSMHAAVLRSMEQRFKDRAGDHAEVLARHAMHGGDWDKAFHYAYEAGKKAFDRSAHNEVVQHLEDALKALHNMGEHSGSRQIDVRFLLRYALLNLGEVERVGRLLSETVPLIQALATPRVTAQFEAFQSNYYCLTDDQPNAVAHGARAWRIAETVQDRALRVEMAYRIAQPYYQLARYSDAIELLEAAVKLIGPDEMHSRFGMSVMPLVVCRTWLTLCYAELGEFSRATDNASSAVELVTKTEHPLSTAFARWGQGHLYLYQRNYGEAVEAFEKGLEICQRWSLRFWVSRLASALGFAHALTGQSDAALTMIEQAVDEAQTMHFAVDAARLFERLATAHLVAGHHALAESKASHALSLATKSNARGHQAWTLRLLGDICLATEPLNGEAADANFCGALDLATKLGMRPLAAHCYEGLSRLHAMRGQKARAEEAMAQARSVWSSLGC
jgi:class 3 adenylate cyclase/tetratricopeptide (TPR) repeat protein